MALLTKALREQMLENGRAQAAAQRRDESIDFKPVVGRVATGDCSPAAPTDPDVRNW
jgi:hypothetical protein